MCMQNLCQVLIAGSMPESSGPLARGKWGAYALSRAACDSKGIAKGEIVTVAALGGDEGAVGGCEGVGRHLRSQATSGDKRCSHSLQVPKAYSTGFAHSRRIGVAIDDTRPAAAKCMHVHVSVAAQFECTFEADHLAGLTSVISVMLKLSAGGVQVEHMNARPGVLAWNERHPGHIRIDV